MAANRTMPVMSIQLNTRPRGEPVRALIYRGLKDIRAVADPKLVESGDIILRVTGTGTGTGTATPAAICGSDLHIYRGKIPTQGPGAATLST